MNELIVYGAFVFAVLLAFIWIAISLRKVRLIVYEHNQDVKKVEEEVSKLFTDDFRNELKQRARVHFEKIINDNAMFLKQDLGLTASQLNEYMQTSLKKVLNEEFEKYKVSISDAKQMALEAITKTQRAMEDQRDQMQKQLNEELEREKKRLIIRMNDNLSQIANSYILQALGDEVDLSSQGDYIFKNLENHKQDIIKDFEDAA